MPTDDSRGHERLNRQAVSTRTYPDGGTDESIQDQLEAIDRLTRSLLADLRTGEATTLEDGNEDTRREAIRHVREIRAEASRVGLLLFGPEAAIPYRPSDPPLESDRSRSSTGSDSEGRGNED
ncbi:hypothetical protein [Natronobacterium gregoryi]|uniref:Uncharacterized protein n=2 Tax=Natronobacterium gregoryi TaxID=44930 RepID=L0AJ24_NATGS|nr:hypothetical protein [Natronobacterium gregoryi]AFZ73449.1 hypothetical protein Natgr_2273 [Natronobacterium gregoryi SP2]ELY68646.1 hypothetical protein C490_09518 [Natronobacterium gregoryi SP2]PLK20481.1 hypothetical protein CYV19_09410 [Natronobacterium gregoryi SP2]SFI71676.1 hypothetical protein SAMN05443661_10453 [Natronobacterium gregoryi]